MIITELIAALLQLRACSASEKPIKAELWIKSDQRLDVIIRVLSIHAKLSQFTDEESVFLLRVVLSVASSVHVRNAELDFREFVARYLLRKSLFHADLLFDPLLSLGNDADQPLVVLDLFITVPENLEKFEYR